jgi:hypothetical protein
MDKVFWGKIITAMLITLITYLLPVVLTRVTVQIKKAKAELKAKRPDLYNTLVVGANMAVSAAEQAGLANIITDKKQYAIGVLQGYLKAHGWGSIDVETIDGAIESAVRDMKFPHANADTTASS